MQVITDTNKMIVVSIYISLWRVIIKSRNTPFNRFARTLDIIVESDRQKVVQCFSSQKELDADISGVVLNCFELCRGFQMMEFTFVKRTGNYIMHTLAQFAQDVNFFVTFIWWRATYSIILKICVLLQVI